MEQVVFSKWFAKRLAYLIAGTVVFAGILSLVLAQAASPAGGEPAWATPAAMAIRRVSQATGARREPVFLNNLDCTTLTYRLVATNAMRTGCFTEIAFGLMDTDDGIVIFNGTDEGLPLLSHTTHQILVPWPKAVNLIGLNPLSTGGTSVGIYNNPLAAMQDQRNALAQLTAKRLDRPADMILGDPAGKSLVINPQTLAFSDGGAWMVAETLGGSFVRVHLGTLSMTAFAPAYGSQGSPALLKSRVAVSDNGRFIAIANDDAAAFRVYDLSTCSGTPQGLQPQGCRSYDYRPFVQQRIEGLQSIRHLRFVNDGLLSFEAIAGPDTSGIHMLAPDSNITSLIDYLGIGDSYASGEGAFDYRDGTDTPDNLCHLSRGSYPLLVAHDLFAASGGHSVACSGAAINDIGSTGAGYRGQMRGVASLGELQRSQPLLLETVETNFIPGYVAQQRFVQRWQPRIVTVGIGGNDIGFGSLVQNCVTPHISLRGGGNTCYGSYEDRLELARLIDRTVPRWTALYGQLRRQAPGMRLYAIGYPQVADADGDCAINVQLDKHELELAAAIVRYLNASIRKAAAAAGVTYVDISQALKGYRLCETASYNVAVNGLTAGTDAGLAKFKVIGRESYHPNALGHSLIRQAVLKQTNNFADAPPDTGPSDAGGAAFPLPDAPVSGRPIRILIPDDSLTDGVGKRGSTLPIRADGLRHSLRPSTGYSIRLDGPDGSLLGTINSNETGDVRGDIIIPTATEPGSHTIDIIGGNQAGEPVTLTQPLYVTVSEADGDGDGIENGIDTCPAAMNSGRDSDRDGTDDICDPLIGPPEAGSGPAGQLVTAGSIPPTRTTGHLLGAATSTDNTGQQDTAPAAGGISRRNTMPRPETIRGFLWLIPACLLLLAGGYVKKAGFRLQWKHMSRVRKGIVYLLSFFLLATLIGTAVSTSVNNTLGKPQKVKTYLAESKLYDHFIAYTTEQAKKTNGDTDQSGSVSLSDAAVQAAAQSSFTPQLIEKSANTFIDSNYAWLEGKTPTPQFSIDLSSQKQTFAEKVGQHVTTYTAGLPECTGAQAAQQSTDPLSATCRPAGTSPEAVGAQVTQRLATTGDFLSNPVVTPNSINPEANQESEPYYEKLSRVPDLYRVGLKLPYVFAGLSLLAALAIIFIAQGRRKGVRRVGIVLLIAGISLVAFKFIADMVFRSAERQVFSDASVGQLQQSLTEFAHRVEESMVRTDLWFGIGFILLAAVIFGVLAATRQKDGGAESPAKPGEGTSDGTDGPSAPLILSRKRMERPAVKDLTPRARPQAEETPPETAQKRKKPPRLVQ